MRPRRRYMNIRQESRGHYNATMDADRARAFPLTQIWAGYLRFKCEVRHVMMRAWIAVRMYGG